MSGGRYSKRKTLLHNLLGIVSIEFAIVIPLLLAMVLATVDFSWLIWSVEAVQQGASNGARCMGVLGNSCTSSGVFRGCYVLSCGARLMEADVCCFDPQALSI